jgi:hypothetical protein
MLWARFMNEKINVVMRIRFDKYLNNNGLNGVATLRGTAKVKAVILRMSRAILYCVKTNRTCQVL